MEESEDVGVIDRLGDPVEKVGGDTLAEAETQSEPEHVAESLDKVVLEDVDDVDGSVGVGVDGLGSPVLKVGSGKLAETDTQRTPEQLGDAEVGTVDSETEPEEIEEVKDGSEGGVVEELDRPRGGGGRLAETERQSKPEHVVDGLAFATVVSPDELEISVDSVGRGTLAVTDMQSSPVHVAEGVKLPLVDAGNEDDVVFAGDGGPGSPVGRVGTGKVAETDKHSRPVHDVDGDGM